MKPLLIQPVSPWCRLRRIHVVALCGPVIFSLLSAIGCAAGDDPSAVAIVKKHVSPRAYHAKTDKDGIERIYSLSIPNKRAALEILPHLDKLTSLTTLQLSFHELSDQDLSALPPLANLKKLVVAQTKITDNGLRHLAGMKNLKNLDLCQTQVHGPGLAYLKDLAELEQLQLGATPVDDNAIPYIVDNFKKLRKLDLVSTQITPVGLMQLVELHSLTQLWPPDDIGGPYANPNEQFVKRRAILRKFSTAHIAAKRRARDAGIEVPKDSLSPFAELGLNPEADSSDR